MTIVQFVKQFVECLLQQIAIEQELRLLAQGGPELLLGVVGRRRGLVQRVVPALLEEVEGGVLVLVRDLVEAGRDRQQAGRLGRAISAAERKTWPVIESAGEIVWMRGFAAPEAFAARVGEAVLIEELREE